MATAVVDIEYLSGYLDVPEPTLSSLLDTPTSELVQSVLQAVAAKAHEHDELVADKLRLDIELENAVRSSETRIEGLRSSVEKAQKNVEEVRTKLNEEENARSTLENELQTLKSSSSTSSSEVETLKARIATLESANRDTLAVLESKTTANDSLAQDLQKQHQKGLELSQQITTLQQSVQNATSAASSAKFREQSLKQEVELAKRNNEWFENELKTKSAEALKYRKEKGARIAELQRLNEESNSNLEALKRTEQALRTRLDEVQKKAEDSLLKVQQLQEAAAKTEEGFRQELESARRLAELQSQQTDTHRNRLKEVEAALEKAKDDAAEEVGRCRQEAEAERQDREQAEHRIAELEAEIDRLEALPTGPAFAGSVPGTPQRGLNGSMFGRPGSPAAFGTPGSVRSKSNITATQAIEELYKVKGQLATEKRHSQKLEAELDEIMQGLEAKAPEHDELQAELTRLQQEVVEMSKFVDQTGKERDRAKKDARKAESQASTSQAEANILRQQLRDLSAQIKMLLCDLDARERGLDALSVNERAQLERLARGEVTEDALEGMTDTDKFISQRLTVFRNIAELQEKNQELLKITRQLGAQMESEEALAAKHQAAKDHEEVQNLQVRIENYKDELKSMVTRSESYIKERDMFRRMLQHRGPIPPGSELASMFGQSVDGSQNGLIQTIEQNPQGRENQNYAVLLRELQAHFDQYREEQTVDRRTLKEQAEKLSTEKGALQAEISKIASQLTFANERYEMLHSNFTMLQNENNELQKRSQTLSEAAAKQDLRTQQVAEDLVEAKGLVESMRNENANLKAEKKLWKDIQDRLSQDNESLMNERSRLNGLIANQQTLQNERELSESETRRRLQTQVETLETELNATKRKLNDEVEDNKKAQLRKEYDAQQSQKRVDDLVASLGSVREELVAAKTTRDHLQARVDELQIELKSAEERVEVLQPRPTPRPGTNGVGSTESVENSEETLSKEQELSIEVSELKRDLELTKSDLENTKNQVEQYKAISQSSEEELQSFNATQDQYREEMDRIIEEKDSKIRELQQRVDDISAELTTTNNELTAHRNQQAEIARQAEEEKAALEIEIARLKDEDERHATAAQFHQQDLRAQAAIATKAQQDYENELVKHAEAAKILQNLRVEYNQLKTDSATLRAEAESAKVALSQSESSWEERREHFEQELSELKARRDDANAQNKLLQQNLEDLGSQITALQQSRSTFAETDDASSTAGTANDRAADGLRELNTFLRREKEIVEVQYELKVQEAKRLQQQLEYAQSQLDESRLKLDQERRSHADGGRTSIAHKDLMEKLNELNLFRESSITLRNEARQAHTQLAEKTKRVEELLEQIQPLENRVRELEHGKETSEGEMRLLQEDRDRWQKRTQDIISKYDRIDPAEMEQLKENLEALKTERDALVEAQQPMQEKLQGLEVEKTSWEERRQKLIEQFKERSRNITKDRNDRIAERDAAVKEKDAIQEQLSALQAELQSAVQEKDAAQQQLTNLRSELETIKSERDQAVAAAAQVSQTSQSADAAPAPVPAQVSAPASAAPNTEALDRQIVDLRQQLATVTQEKQALKEELTNLQHQLEMAKNERDKAVSEAAEARSLQSASAPNTSMENGVEDGQIDETAKTSLTDAERKTLEDRVAVAEAKAKEQEEKATKIEESMDVTLKARSDKMKTALNNKLAESRQAAKTQLEAEYALKLEQEKQIWLAENKPTVAATVTPAPLEPVKEPDQAVPATPATPITATPAAFDSNNLSDAQVRELLSTNPTVKAILTANIKKKVEAETAKLKQEQDRIIAEVQQKADSAKTQAVLMEGKKSALKINMESNKSRAALAKITVVETAARDTPEKPVGEVWEIAKNTKPPPPPQAPTPAAAPVTAPAATVATAVPANETTADTSNSSIPVAQPEVKTEPSQNTVPGSTNGTSALPVSNIGTIAPQQANNARPNSGIPQPTSGIPQPRGGGAAGQRGGRGGAYQRGAANFGAGRGRGGNAGSPTRGGMNPGATNFNPNGPVGLKRPRDEGSIGGMQGNNGKRARGGGQN